MNRFQQLSHSKWECKYHVVWIPKYRRKELYGNKRKVIIGAIKKWASNKGVEILEYVRNQEEEDRRCDEHGLF